MIGRAKIADSNTLPRAKMPEKCAGKRLLLSIYNLSEQDLPLTLHPVRAGAQPHRRHTGVFFPGLGLQYQGLILPAANPAQCELNGAKGWGK
jgi:hypothetical protein